MKNYNVPVFLLLLLTVTSCEAIGDIFSAGFYSGLALVVLIAIVIVWLIGRRR